MAINASDINKAIQGINWHILQDPEEYEWVKEEEIVLKDVINEFAQRHHPIEKYFFSGMGVKLQFLDSRIAEIIINELTFNRMRPTTNIEISRLFVRNRHELIGLIIRKCFNSN